MNPEYGHNICRQMYPTPQPCELCGALKSAKKRGNERHHQDGDCYNNAPENVQWLCNRCHKIVDGRLKKMAKRMKRFQPLGVQASAAKHRDTEIRSGDACPSCGGRLYVIQTTVNYVTQKRLVYIGCPKRWGGCGRRAGSYRQPLEGGGG